MEDGFKPCPHCAEPIREAAKICRYCNRPVDGSSQPNVVPNVVQVPATKLSSNRAKVLSAVLVTLLAYLFVGQRLLFPPTNPLRIPVSPQVVVLARGNYAVQRGGYISVPFSIPQRATRASIKGQFHAFGGAGNDIQVLICNPRDFENLDNGHAGIVLYNSEKTTNGEVDAQNVPPGDYVLAFNNKFSGFSRKEVSADIVLAYWP